MQTSVSREDDRSSLSGILFNLTVQLFLKSAKLAFSFLIIFLLIRRNKIVLGTENYLKNRIPYYPTTDYEFKSERS